MAVLISDQSLYIADAPTFAGMTLTGDLTVGNFVFDSSQSVGAGQDNFVLTYDNAGGKISLEAATGGNPFDQNLNTTDSPTFATQTLTGTLQFNTSSGAVLNYENLALELEFDINNTEVLRLKFASAAVNNIQLTNAATGSGPIIEAIGSDLNIDVNVTPKGTGNFVVGNFSFDADQTVGAGQDNFVLTYDNATGLISLEAASGGINNVVEDTTPQLGGNVDPNSFGCAGDWNPSVDSTHSLGISGTQWLATYSDRVFVENGSASAPGYSFRQDDDTGFYRSTNTLSATIGSLEQWRTIIASGVSHFRVRTGLTIGELTADNCSLYQDAAAQLALRNGTTAQSFRVYNTYTNSSNYERGVFDWVINANELTIGAVAAGTGTERALRIVGSTCRLDATDGIFSFSGTSYGVQKSGTGMCWLVNGQKDFIIKTDKAVYTADHYRGWTNTTTADTTDGNTDTRMYREAAQVVSFRNGTNTNSIRIYNTFDGVDDEYVEFGFKTTSNVAEIKTVAGGVGTQRDIQLNGANRAAKISDPSGGATQDAEARTAINAIIDALESHGISATV